MGWYVLRKSIYVWGVHMKRSMLGVAAAAAASMLVLGGPASASHTAEFTGTILVGNPMTGIVGGVTENVEGCSPGGATEGLDGVWFDIAGFGGGTGVLTNADTLDGDVWFYTAGCGFINNAAMAAKGLGETETGAIPEAAAYAVVDGFVGTGDFTLSLTGPPDAS